MTLVERVIHPPSTLGISCSPLLAAIYINGMAVRLVINMGLELVELVELELVDSSGVTDRGLDGLS